MPHSLAVSLHAQAREQGKLNIRFVTFPASLGLGHTDIYTADSLPGWVSPCPYTMDLEGCYLNWKATVLKLEYSILFFREIEQFVAALGQSSSWAWVKQYWTVNNPTNKMVSLNQLRTTNHILKVLGGKHLQCISKHFTAKCLCTEHSTYGACYGKQCQDGPDVTAFSEDWVADNFSTLHERDPTRACQMQLLSSTEIEAAVALSSYATNLIRISLTKTLLWHLQLKLPIVKPHSLMLSCDSTNV